MPESLIIGPAKASGRESERPPVVFISSAAPFWRGWNILGILAGLALSVGCSRYAIAQHKTVHVGVLAVMLAAAGWMLFCTVILLWRCVYVRFRHSEIREDGILIGSRLWSWEQVFEFKAERTRILGWYQPVFFTDRHDWNRHVMRMEWPMTPFQYRMLMLRLRRLLGRVHPHVMLDDPFGDQQMGSDRLCLGCGYDLRATPGRCPECGQVPAGNLTGVRVVRADGGMGIPI